jgi:hypothetical protein
MNQTIAVHEIGHAIIALSRGFVVKRISVNGPPHHPGNVDRDLPPEELAAGKNSNDPDWALRDLAVFCAGYVAEKVALGDHNEPCLNGHPDADRPMMDQCALMHLAMEADQAAVLKAGDPSKVRHEWRKRVAIDWGVYDAVIEVTEEDVRKELAPLKDDILRVAEILLAEKLMTGARLKRLLATPAAK